MEALEICQNFKKNWQTKGIKESMYESCQTKNLYLKLVYTQF